MSKSHQSDSVEHLREFLESYEYDPSLDDDFFAWEACKLALQAVESNNFGIGSIIVDPFGTIVAEGYNQVFHPYFRSDRHGEMVAMENFENQYRELTSMRGYTLYTSLESCPMCMTRLITSRCERIIHIADDPLGGMVNLRSNLPPVWTKLLEQQVFIKAKCSKEIEDVAQKIFMSNAEELNSLLSSRLDK
jgi:tRNA(Arg) A34 adenosine deaminase TadA